MDKQAQLKNILELLNASVTKTEVMDAFKTLLSFVSQLKQANAEEMSLIKSAVSVMGEKWKEQMQRDIESFKGQALKDIQKALREQEQGMKFIYDKVSSLKDGENGKDADEQQVIQSVLAQIPPDVEETPTEVRDKLETLSGDERLDISAIKGLDERLAGIKQTTPIIYGGTGTGGGRLVKSYDLSDSLNGILKTFSLPAFWRVISVHSSSFPMIFRPTTDYTTDAGASTITFTSEVDAASTLATGQTIIVVYAET